MKTLQTGDRRQVGPYQLTHRLGAGGMGEVYLASSRAGRQVVVKLVHQHLADDPGFRRRFAQEIEAARSVGGFYTAQLLDADTEAGRPWLATAYIPGPTLSEAVHAGGPLPEDRVRALAAGLAEGLMAIHRCGIVHRDLTPRNVILAEDGPRVIDFGIARALDSTHHTASGFIGTPGYMSPEHILGNPVGPASDVFSLGCVLAFAAVARPPFGADAQVAALYRVAHGEPDLSEIPAGLRGLVDACLAKDPAKRPGLTAILDRLDQLSQLAPAAPAPAPVAVQPSAGVGQAPHTATALAADILRTPPPPGPSAPTGPVTSAAPTGPSGPAPRGPGRRRLLLAGAGAVVAAVVGGVAGALESAHSATPAAAATTGGTPTATGKPAAGSAPTATAPALHPGAPVTLGTGDGNAYLGVGFSPDGVLTTVGDGGNAVLLDLGTKTSTLYRHQSLDPALATAGTQYAFTVSLSFSPVGGALAVGNGDGTVSVWNRANGTETVLHSPNALTAYAAAINPVAFHPSGTVLANAYNAPSVSVWDPATQQVTATLPETGSGDWTSAVAFAPSGAFLVTASGNGASDADDANGVLQFWHATAPYGAIGSPVRLNTLSYGLAVSPDSKTLAVLGEHGAVTLWDTATRAELGSLAGDSSGATCLAFGAGGLLAAGFADGTVTIWDAASGAKAAALSTGGTAALHSVAFSPDGKSLASGGASLTLWTLS